MPPYLVNPAPSLSAEWLRNPDPDLYTSWQEFTKQLFWDYQAVGEAFVIATARYSTGWPARFHVVPPYLVNVEMDGGRRSYMIGQEDVTADVLHLRYQSSVDDARGHGPLEVGQYRVVAAQTLARYGTKLASEGGVPFSILKHPEELDAQQAEQLKQQWVAARLAGIGEPAVLTGGMTWEATQLNPRDMALLELQQFHEGRIAILLRVPPFLVGLPGGGDSMTYSNANMVLDFHWRAGLRTEAVAVMTALSEWLLPRGTTVELNSDAYIQPGPLERAQTYQILAAITDADGTPVMSVDQIQTKERLNTDVPADLSSGVLK